MLGDRIQTILNEGVLGNVFSGASFLAVKGGKELIYSQSGCMNKEGAIPLERDTLFRICSMTKPVTAVAAMMLVEQGLIDLNAPVSAYLPGFINQQYYDGGKLKKVEREATVADLLGMTSGLTYEGNQDTTERLMSELFSACEKAPLDTVSFINKAAACPLPFCPGKRFRYGISADALGAVIQVVAKKSLADFMREMLFEPLDMHDTGFFVPAEKQCRLATVYERDRENRLVPYLKPHFMVSDKATAEPILAAGGAGLMSTIDDYMKFAQMLLGLGTYKGKRILSPETVRYMTTPQLTPEQLLTFGEAAQGYSYGRLMRVRTQKGLAHTLGNVSEYGWSGMLGTHFVNDPVQNMTLLFMTQRKDTPSDTLVNRMINAVYGSL